MYFSINDKEKLLKEIKNFKDKGYKDKFIKIYKKLPKTKCKGCGLCCNDSPIISYPEFLFIYDYFIDDSNFNNEERISIYKNAVREHMIGLISKNIACPFLDKDKRCLVYDRAPVSCKRWGIQSRAEYEVDLFSDHQRNKDYKNYYAGRGIDIPKEVIDFQTPYCENVKIEKNTYHLTSRDFETIVLKEIGKINENYRHNNAMDWSVGSYLLYSILGSTIFEDRINVINEFQKGNTNAVEEYIDGIDFMKFV